MTPPRQRRVLGADGHWRRARCDGRRQTTRSGRCCQPTGPCCVRPGGATLYLPPVEPAFPNPIGGTVQVEAGGSGDFIAWSTALQDFVGPGGPDEDYVLQITSNRWSIDHTLALDAAQFALQTLANGCIRGLDLAQQFFLPGEPVGAPVGAYDGQYLLRTNAGAVLESILLTGEPLYLHKIILGALHPAWTGVAPTPGTPRWSLSLEYHAAFVPLGNAALLPRITMFFEFGDYCQVNAAQSRIIGVPSLGLPEVFPPLVGPYLILDTDAGLDPATVVQPQGASTVIGGGDSLRWGIDAVASERRTATNAYNAAAQAVYAASARAVIALAHTSAGGSASRFTACPDFPPLVEPCNPTGANACCEDDADCGKVDPLAPYRWRRVRQGFGSIEDMDPAGIVSTVPGWVAVPTPIDDIQAMAPGTPDCELSPGVINTSQGSAFNTDRLGTSRVLILSGTAAQVNGAQVPARVQVEPIAGTGVAKRWRVTMSQPVRWPTQQALAADVILGFLRITAETPAVLPPGGAGAQLTITQAEFEWTDLPINPTTGYNGFALDAAVNPDPIEDLTANVAGFAYLASFGPDGCLRAVQLVPELGAGLPNILCDTTRFGWLTDSTATATTATRRKLRIRLNAAPYFELLNIGACPQAGALASPPQGCIGCRDGGIPIA